MPEPEPIYQVRVSGAIARLLEELERQAVREGRGKQALAAIKHINQRLEKNPTELESRYTGWPASSCKSAHAHLGRW